MTTDNSAKKMQEDLKESAYKIWLAGLGALSAAEEEGERLFKRLVEKGEEMESKGKNRMEDAQAAVSETLKDVEKSFDERLTGALQRIGVPSREEIRTLTRRVEELNRKVEELNTGKASA